MLGFDLVRADGGTAFFSLLCIEGVYNRRRE